MMEQMLASLGFLMVIYGLYLAINALPADPLLKGSVTALIGALLIVVAYILSLRHRQTPPETKDDGWVYR
jgi:hypothetical protein